MTYQCHNRGEFAPSVSVQDGLTQERLMELAVYEPESGLIKKKPRITADGRLYTCEIIVKKSRPKNYRKLSFDGRSYFVHRLAFLYMTGSFPAGLVDHIDGDITNNRWANLRVTTYQQNTQANHRGNRNNTSGFRGVYWCKQKRKWQAKIMVDRREEHLGFYECPEKAHKAYLHRKAEVHFR